MAFFFFFFFFFFFGWAKVIYKAEMEMLKCEKSGISHGLTIGKGFLQFTWALWKWILGVSKDALSAAKSSAAEIEMLNYEKWKLRYWERMKHIQTRLKKNQTGFNNIFIIFMEVLNCPTWRLWYNQNHIQFEHV